jgi:hypothetical protein
MEEHLRRAMGLPEGRADVAARTAECRPVPYPPLYPAMQTAGYRAAVLRNSFDR